MLAFKSVKKKGHSYVLLNLKWPTKEQANIKKKKGCRTFEADNIKSNTETTPISMQNNSCNNFTKINV